jgi:hypothetical protein
MVHVWITPHECGPFAALEGVAAGVADASDAERVDLCNKVHLLIFNTTVFETLEPFFGVTVRVTLHTPFLIPFTEVPATLQYLAELGSTFTPTFAPEGTLTFAYFAREAAVAAFEEETTG